MPACADELRDIMRTLLIRLQAAGEIDPAVSLEYCCTAIFSAVVGGPDRAVLYRGVRDTERPAGEFKNAAASDITGAAIKSSP